MNSLRIHDHLAFVSTLARIGGAAERAKYSTSWDSLHPMGGSEGIKEGETPGLTFSLTVVSSELLFKLMGRSVGCIGGHVSD